MQEWFLRRTALMQIFLISLAGLALLSTTLGVGTYLDDHADRDKYAIWNHTLKDVMGSYKVVATPQEGDNLPWFVDPAFFVANFRPLAEALLFFDHHYLDEDLLLHRLHSLLWHAISLVLAGVVLRRAMPDGPWKFALFVYAISAVNYLPASWLAMRYAVASTAFGWGCLAAHLYWREEKRFWALPLSLFLMLLALLCSEAALGVAAYVGAYELVRALTKRGASISSFATSMLAGCAPLAILAVAYLIGYSAMHYGAAGSAFLVDPLREPGRYLLLLPGRLLLCIAGILTGFSIDIVPCMGFTALTTWNLVNYTFMAVGIILLCAWLPSMFRLWPNLAFGLKKSVAWLALGSLISMLPACADVPTARHLSFPALGITAAVTVQLFAWHRAWREGELRSLQRYSAGLIAVLVLMLPFVLWPVQAFAFEQLHNHEIEISTNVTLPPDIDKDTVFVLASTDIIAALGAPYVRMSIGLPATIFWAPLSVAPGPHHLKVLDDHSFLLTAEEGSLFNNFLIPLHRRDYQHMRPGTEINRRGYHVKLISVHDGMPTAAEFRFDRKLDDPSLIWLVMDHGKLVHATMPSPGEVLQFVSS